MSATLLSRLSGLLGLVLVLSSCDSGVADSAAPVGGTAANPNGQAGSLARFAIMGNTLYAVDETHLRTFSLSNPATPAPGPVVSLGTGVETIFPQAPYLFIGSQTGMFIFDTTPATPRLVGTYTHAVSCDPVVVAGQYAYVTLRNDGPCTRGLNQLDVVDLQDLSHPQLAQSYPLTKPYGLGVDESQLFVCDNGIKVFDTSQAPTLRLLQSFNLAATDVIAHRGVLLVTGADGLYQYRYTAAGAGNLTQLSRIPVVPN